MAEIAERLRWAVELLDVRPGQRVLEIGGGNGLAASLILDRIGQDGRITFLDRSATAIDRASRRHRIAMEAGRFLPVQGELADCAGGDTRFDRVLAINVNLFWTGDASQEVGLITSMLEARAQVLIAYETPSQSRLQEIEPKLEACLSAGGLRIETHRIVERSLLGVRGFVKT
jgi:SAM-dependent methyltransferase